MLEGRYERPKRLARSNSAVWLNVRADYKAKHTAQPLGFGKNGWSREIVIPGRAPGLCIQALIKFVACRRVLLTQIEVCTMYRIQCTMYIDCREWVLMVD